MQALCSKQDVWSKNKKQHATLKKANFQALTRRACLADEVFTRFKAAASH